MTYYERHIAKLKEKFGVERLELAGESEQPREATLQDLVKQQERDTQKGYNLCFGSTEYKGERVPIYFELSRKRV